MPYFFEHRRAGVKGKKKKRRAGGKKNESRDFSVVLDAAVCVLFERGRISCFFSLVRTRARGLLQGMRQSCLTFAVVEAVFLCLWNVSSRFAYIRQRGLR